MQVGFGFPVESKHDAGHFGLESGRGKKISGSLQKNGGMNERTEGGDKQVSLEGKAECRVLYYTAVESTCQVS